MIAALHHARILSIARHSAGLFVSNRGMAQRGPYSPVNSRATGARTATSTSSRSAITTCSARRSGGTSGLGWHDNLCIGCLEMRLGRRLRLPDFASFAPKGGKAAQGLPAHPTRQAAGGPLGALQRVGAAGQGTHRAGRASARGHRFSTDVVLPNYCQRGGNAVATLRAYPSTLLRE